MDQLVRIVILVWAATVLVGQQIIGTMSMRTRAKPVKQPWTLGELMFRLIAVLMLGPYFSGHVARIAWLDYRPLRLLGLVPVAGGLVLSLWAYSELGQYWVNGVGLYPNHALITTGPYARLRHPVYSGIFLAMAGITLAAADKAVGIACAAYCMAYLYRMPREEILLMRRFRKGHERYCRQAGFIFPRFRRPRM